MGWVSGCAIVTLVLIGCFAVYVFTNYELRAHLDTSRERLILHVWTSILLLLALAVKPSALDGVDKKAKLQPNLHSFERTRLVLRPVINKSGCLLLWSCNPSRSL